jgi:PAS domain S-box-containing protein
MPKPEARATLGRSEPLALELDELRLENEQLRAEYERLRLEHEHLLEAQQLIDKAHSNFVQAYDLAPQPLLTLDRAGSIRHVNRAGAKLLGQSSAHLLGRHLRTFVAQDDRPALAQHMATARSRAEHTCELRLARMDGVSVRARLRMRVSEGDGGLLQVAMLDLSDREPELEEMRRLVESERVAREATTAKDKFIAVLSHELRTPLTPLLAASSLMLSRKNTPPDLAAVFEMIRRNVLMETRLIDDLLDVTRIVRGQMLVELKLTDIHQVAREAAEILGEEAAKKTHSIHVALVAERHWANADPLRLRQVFLNLLRNAIKFTPEGGDIHLTSWNAGDRLTVEVEDTGIGLAPEALEHLFEPFEPIDEDWSKRGTGGGLGLGLAISKGLVDLQGGNLFAGSGGRNQGARFAVQLATVPVEVAPPPVVEEKAASAPLPELAEATDPRRTPRILLVDDHPDTLEMMTELMREMGCDVERARSVSSALAVDMESVDLIVSDIGLPDGTGLDLIRELRSNGHRRPAIAVSGFGMESDVRASKEAGFDLHLTKPVDFKVLFDAVRALSAQAEVERRRTVVGY